MFRSELMILCIHLVDWLQCGFELWVSSFSSHHSHVFCLVILLCRPPFERQHELQSSLLATYLPPGFTWRSLLKEDVQSVQRYLLCSTLSVVFAHWAWPLRSAKVAWEREREWAGGTLCVMLCPFVHFWTFSWQSLGQPTMLASAVKVQMNQR